MGHLPHGFVASVFIAAGWLGILMEFLRPGWVIPGVAGGVFLLVGLARILPEHPGIAIAASVPFLLAAWWLLGIAWKARKNKRTL